MRLPEESLTVDQQLDEFDYWLTPSQVIYHTTSRYKQEMEDAVSLIESLSTFISKEAKFSLDVTDIAHFIFEESSKLITGESPNDDLKTVGEYIYRVFQLLFLVTASSDNNLKTQFTVHLKTTETGLEYTDFKLYKKKETKSVDTAFSPISTISADRLSRILAKYIVAISSPNNLPSAPSSLAWNLRFNQILESYIGLIFNNSGTEQLYYLCKAYKYIASLNPDEHSVNFGEFLLRSTIIYKIKGSITASEGHNNEHVLRDRLRLLGLQPMTDFNLTDVVIKDIEESEGSEGISHDTEKEDQAKEKKRAFDFVLPYNIEGWNKEKNKIYIQAQFYAGDSGSVSHKVVDQTRKSRDALKAIIGNNHRFVEYLDGAGYASALRGDLRKLLEYEDTDSFIQIKSILIRLRREMQIIDYANPTDLAQAIYLAGEDNTKARVEQIMQGDFGFSREETNRVLEASLQQEQIALDNGNLTIMDSELQKSARWTFILDHVVLEGQPLSKEQREDSKYFIVPGYGSAYGALGSTIQDKITEISEELSLQFVRDTESLVDLGALKHGGKYA